MFQSYIDKYILKSHPMPFLVLFCMIFFGSFFFSFSGVAGNSVSDARKNEAEPRIVAKIGVKGLITERDLADFTASESCYGPNAINSRKAGFMRMLEATVREEIIRREEKSEITPADYETEIERVDRDTRAPKILMCVKKYFGFDAGTKKFKSSEGRNRYKKVFLRKYLAHKRVFRFTHYDSKFQKKAYRLKELVKKKGGKGAALSGLSEKHGLVYSTHTYTLEDRKDDAQDIASSSSAITALADKPAMPWSPFEKRFIEEHLAKLKAGEMKKEPIESAYDMQFIKLLSAVDGKYYFQSLRIKKRDDYFQISPKLRCDIKDAELKKWILSISGNPMLGILKFD